jgi:hypothetical protein
VKGKSMDRLIHNPDTGTQEKDGFEESGEVLYLPVAIKMGLIRRPPGDSNGKEGHQGSHKIEAGVCGFGKDTQTACGQADHYFKNGKPNGSKNRDECNRSFFLFSLS